MSANARTAFALMLLAALSGCGAQPSAPMDASPADLASVPPEPTATACAAPPADCQLDGGVGQ